MRPYPTTVNISKSEKTFEVVWADGHRSRFALAGLRGLCDCANCRDQRAARPAAAPPVLALPVLGQPNPAQLISVEHVGRYAFGVTWADRHYSIYSYIYLRACCPCEACTEARRESSPPKSSGGEHRANAESERG